MSVAKVTEIISSSETSFEDAINVGVSRACKTFKNVKGAWVKEQTVKIKKEKISEYRVALMVTLMAGGLQAQSILEAEDAYYSSGKIDTKHAGYTGTGFVDTENLPGEYIEWFLNVDAAASDSLGFRYALGKDEHRYMEVYLNHVLLDTIDFDNTGAFTTWVYKSLEVSLDSGINREGCILDLALEHNLIERSGTWYSYQTNRIGQGRDNACTFLKENPDILEELDQSLRKILKEMRAPVAKKEEQEKAPEIDPETGEILDEEAAG